MNGCGGQYCCCCDLVCSVVMITEGFNVMFYGVIVVEMWRGLKRVSEAGIEIWL